LRRWSGWHGQDRRICQLLTDLSDQARRSGRDMRSTAPLHDRRADRGISMRPQIQARQSATAFCPVGGKPAIDGESSIGGVQSASDLAMGASQAALHPFAASGSRDLDVSGGSRRRGVLPWRQTARGLPNGNELRPHRGEPLQATSAKGMRRIRALWPGAIIKAVFDVSNGRRLEETTRASLTQGDITQRRCLLGVRAPCLKQ